MKIAVIGAGMQGSACAFDLARSAGVGEVRLLDQQEDRLDATRRRVEAGAREAGKSPAITSILVDVADGDAMARALHGFDVAVSAVPYFLNVGLARTALRAGASFCDMGGNTDVVREELSLHAEALAAGVSLIPDCGLAPGLGNILVADGIASLDRATEAHIRVGGLPKQPRPPLNYKLVFSAYGLINEYVGEATYLREGRRTAVAALSELETIDFPGPIGRCEAFVTAGGTSTLPWTFEGKLRELTYKTVRYPGHAEMIRSMAACGLFSLDPVEVPAEDGGKVRIRPREATAAALTRALDFPGDTDLVVLRVTVKGTRGGKRVTRAYELIDSMDEIHGITAMMRTTAYPVSVVAQMIARGDVTGRGALPLETAIPPAPFLRALAERRIDIQQTEVIEEAAR
ncbi:MAG: saccharopine dehydrogenase NADP-binding domain-containing protein [Acidobacteria bacterium]|nr:saccharopine dehydrogenase NADP-binding domain-containing protein [Acidobacteriota bacterium]